MPPARTRDTPEDRNRPAGLERGAACPGGYPQALEGGRIVDLSELADAVEEGNPDRLLRLIDALSSQREWDGLVDLRSRCRHAVDRGKQLWAVAEHIEYRLALEAPAQWAGPMVVEGAGRFTLGPLAEVAASRHTWSELSPHLPEGPARAIVAHERVVRGEDLTGEPGLDPAIIEIPMRLEPFEPSYALATYHSAKAEFPTPETPRLREVELPATAPPQLDDLDASEALLGLTRAWTEESNGRAEALAVQGDAPGAIRALGPRQALLAPVSPQVALALMAWTGASGGAYGRRRGAAAGRYGAWWAMTAIADLLDEWPVRAEDLGNAIQRMRWFAWSDLVPPTGWTFHLAVEDPARRRAWAIAAVDAK